MKLNRSPFNLTQGAVKSKSASEILIFDEIGFFGVTAKEFTEQLNVMDSDEINIRINSPGGSVFEGMAIFEAIKRHKSKTIIHIDGLAASIASVIALAGDEIVMSEGAFFMIHEVWSIVMGTSDDMRKEADTIDKIQDTVIGIYARNSDLNRSEVLDAVKEETWFNAEEALEAGFINRISGDKSASNKFDLSIFNNVPGSLGEPIEPNIREIEKHLRDSGYSKKQALAFVSAGSKAVERSDSVPNAYRSDSDLEAGIDPVTQLTENINSLKDDMCNGRNKIAGDHRQVE